MIYQHIFTFKTAGKGTLEITKEVAKLVTQQSIETGLCHLFIHHTSASLTICENADSDVRKDLESFMSRLVPEDMSIYRHNTEGPDDMPAHIRTVLTDSSLSIPITQGKLALGTWQGIYIWEHRSEHQQRKITVTLLS